MRLDEEELLADAEERLRVGSKGASMRLEEAVRLVEVAEDVWLGIDIRAEPLDVWRRVVTTRVLAGAVPPDVLRAAVMAASARMPRLHPDTASTVCFRLVEAALVDLGYVTGAESVAARHKPPKSVKRTRRPPQSRGSGQ